jgi:ribA/ribD-fused uncharacterized protein
MERNTLFFYDQPSQRVRPENVFLNNFFESPFVLHGKEFKTVEHFYQSSKFSGEYYENIRKTSTPDEAKKLARKLPFNLQEWEERKDQVMKEGLFAKFEQNPELKKRLIETGNSRLVEDSPRDAYWGGVVEGSCNRLGQMLEELREKYKSEEKLSYFN